MESTENLKSSRAKLLTPPLATLHPLPYDGRGMPCGKGAHPYPPKGRECHAVRRPTPALPKGGGAMRTHLI